MPHYGQIIGTDDGNEPKPEAANDGERTWDGRDSVKSDSGRLRQRDAGRG